MSRKKIILKVNELEKILSNHHHNDAWNQIKIWFEQFGKNYTERMKFLKKFMYASKPLISTDGEVDEFHVLQGDIIKTKAAVTSGPLFDFDPLEYSYYLIVPSSCSVQPKKYRQVLLARLSPITKEKIENTVTNAFLQSINLKNNRSFYFPPIDGVVQGEFGFLAVFEEISYIANELLQSVQRVASLSLIGWHFLNAFLVNHYSRPSSDDLKLRRLEYDNEWSFYE